MADIAILVAEEYERRVKTGRKAGGGAAAEIQGEYCEFDHLVSSASTMAQSLKMTLAKWVREPKTQISLAASDGFFSA
ncbi:hypothetical protein FH972_002725 [Carpinus fangiana]|uniref:Uncharacterized protein n=1 Tax=Carpinus fangiana TaxID=176857 RepID=A0A5N6QFQ6_9ROSI|nr:hypothetical protein FH972_002725 [Carpinus fangiana]